MGVPIASGVFDNARILTPEHFAEDTLVEWHEESIIPQVCNTQGKGQISESGDKITFTGIPQFVIDSYVKGGGVTYGDPESPTVQVLIDKAYNYAFRLFDVDKKQTHLDGIDAKWVGQAKYNLDKELGTDFWAALALKADAANAGNTAGPAGDIDMGSLTSPLSVTKSNAMDQMLKAELILDEQDVPPEDRWFVMSPHFYLKLGGGQLSEANKMGDDSSVLRMGGKVGPLAGFQSYKHNWLPRSGTKHYCFFGTKAAVAFHLQILESETIRAQDEFAWFYRGLAVCGYEALKPEGLGYIVFELGSD